MNSLIGLAVAAFGIWNIVQAQLDPSVDTTPLWWAKMATAVGVGGFIGLKDLWGFVPNLGNFFKSANKPTLPESDNMATVLPGNIEIKTEEQSDLEALWYITERCKDNPEARELCMKLSEVFFNKHHPKVG